MNRQDYFRMMRHSKLAKQAMVKNATTVKPGVAAPAKQSAAQNVTGHAGATPEQRQDPMRQLNEGVDWWDKNWIDPQTGLSRGQLAKSMSNTQQGRDAVYAQQKQDKKRLYKQYDDVVRQRNKMYRDLQKQYAAEAKVEYNNAEKQAEKSRQEAWKEHGKGVNIWNPDVVLPGKLMTGLNTVPDNSMLQQNAYRDRLNRIEENPEYAALLAKQKRILDAIGRGAHQML